MTFLGKIHEIVFYGTIAAAISVLVKKVALSSLIYSAFHPSGLAGYFQAYMAWSVVLLLPIALITALETKYRYNGEGLGFYSDKLTVIIFAHFGQEIAGLLYTPFWFISYLFTWNFDFWRVVDLLTYALELAVIIFCLLYT